MLDKTWLVWVQKRRRQEWEGNASNMVQKKVRILVNAHASTILSPSHFQKPSPDFRPNLPSDTFWTKVFGKVKIFSSGIFSVQPLRIAWQVSRPTKSASWNGPCGIPEEEMQQKWFNLQTKKANQLQASWPCRCRHELRHLGPAWGTLASNKGPAVGSQ